jgi:hypothetical protein
MAELKRNYKFQINPADLIMQVQDMDFEQRGRYFTTFFRELYNDDAEACTIQYAKDIIVETYTFRKSKQKSGEKGAKIKYANSPVVNSIIDGVFPD